MFKLTPSQPSFADGMDPASVSKEQGLIALDIQSKYQFTKAGAGIVHEYEVPSNFSSQNLGGYFDKLAKYRDESLFDHLSRSGPTKEAFATDQFPILSSRSPQLDLAALPFIKHLYAKRRERVSLLDHGCSVAEHFDFLGLLLRASGMPGSADILSYTGLDISPILLAAAKMLHADVDGEHFRLLQREGSALDFPDRSFSMSITMGVVNHVANPYAALDDLLRITSDAAVMALWVTDRDEGFFAIGHSGVANYFFSYKDLERLQNKHADGRFLVVDFIPESSSSQRSSYVGITAEQERSLGSYHLIFSRVKDLPVNLHALTF